MLFATKHSALLTSGDDSNPEFEIILPPWACRGTATSQAAMLLGFGVSRKWARRAGLSFAKSTFVPTSLPSSKVALS
ncbi:hypothetical protein MES5069_780009 [Mesorhizobium escarrei]|uniref:Uncharacterized protein n=1 Tax=Mesorhizobium escarrei TaxID=666018 RepID=A0ABN8KKJ0_9HYPH|nr:hypothetical protein MES5069_780009 [Mesorhizobium escarrei]